MEIRNPGKTVNSSSPCDDNWKIFYHGLYFQHNHIIQIGGILVGEIFIFQMPGL